MPIPSEGKANGAAPKPTLAGRFEWKDLIGYWIVQLLGGIAGAAVLYLIASGTKDFTAGGFASNGYGELSPGGYSMLAALICEVVLTAVFLLIILGSTSKAASNRPPAARPPLRSAWRPSARAGSSAG